MGIRNPQYDIDLLTNDGQWAEEGRPGTNKVDPYPIKGNHSDSSKSIIVTPKKQKKLIVDNIYYTEMLLGRDQDDFLVHRSMPTM